MKRTLSLVAAGIAGALIALLALSFAAGAFAQGPGGQPAQATPGATPHGQAQMMGRGQMGQGRMGQGQMLGGSAQSLVGMAAAQLGLTQADLVAQLGSDGTIAAALTAGGVDPAAFIDSFVASRAARLDAAVAAGSMIRQDADARLATARSMATARIYQPFSALGPGGQGLNAGQGDGSGDGVCDQMPAGGQGGIGGGRG
ncbi:MAG: hypothetical protein HGA45_16765, partial [Chloroflexales bacterium]|nr:hypothetical protein [Chloroflexales bacterium]